MARQMAREHPNKQSDARTKQEQLIRHCLAGNVYLLCLVFVYTLSTFNYDEIELKSHPDVKIYITRATIQIKPETV
jgi:hypothetical protein